MMILHGVIDDQYWIVRLTSDDALAYGHCFIVNRYKAFTDRDDFTREVLRVMSDNNLSRDTLYTTDPVSAIELYACQENLLIDIKRVSPTIDYFDGTENDFLSNFHPCVLEYEGIIYQTTEHAYQAMKTLDNEIRLNVASMSTPGKAKRMGRELKLRSDWEHIKDGVMYDVCSIKFKYPRFAKQLLATGDGLLIEGNGWNDQYWGVDSITGVGLNKLGKTLMKIRSELWLKLPVVEQ